MVLRSIPGYPQRNESTSRFDVCPSSSHPIAASVQTCLSDVGAEEAPSRVPWLSILTSVPVWAITCAHVTQAFGVYVLLTELPNYMKNILDMDLKTKVL